MSIFIKTTMDSIPNSCTECKMGKRYGAVGDVKCTILNEYFTGNVNPPYKERPDECPLVDMGDFKFPSTCGECNFIGHYKDGPYRRNPHCCCELIWRLRGEDYKVNENSLDEGCPLRVFK